MLAVARAGRSDDEPVLDQDKLKTFAFVTGIFSVVGAVVLIPVMTIQRAAEAFDFEITYAKTLATIGCLGNIAYVSPNLATLVNAATYSPPCPPPSQKTAIQSFRLDFLPTKSVHVGTDRTVETFGAHARQPGFVPGLRRWQRPNGAQAPEVHHESRST